MLFKIVIFILFLGPLVFFHELGHFLFARLFGVRVEVFSIGFGPKLFQKKWGNTVYAFSLIPLGGYVKMFGEDLLQKDEIPAEEKQYSFSHKGKMARFWIVLGGPLANFLLAGVLFFFLSLVGEKAPEMRLGVISQYSKLYSMGFRSADVLIKVNNFKINSPIDFPIEQLKMVKTVVVKRNKISHSIEVNLPVTNFFKLFMSVPPLLRAPFVVDEHGKRWTVSVVDKIIADISLERLSLVANEKLFLFPVGDKNKGDELITDKQNQHLLLIKDIHKTVVQYLMAHKFYPLDLVVKSVSMGSAADKAKLEAGDIILGLNGKLTFSFEDLRTVLSQSKQKIIPLRLMRKGKLMTVNVEPQVKKIGGKQRRLIGVYSAGEFLGAKFVNIPGKGIGKSISLAISRTWLATVKTFSGFKKLLTAQVSLKAVGGPLSIGKVAADSFETSLSYFFQIMALISVNLGLINLFPIPVLDGGHIFFILFELINRGPLSRRKLEIAQQFGLSILLFLMVAALYNDFTRFFWG